MIGVRLLYDSRGWRGYTVEGHAEYAARGEDIVCAAISALAQTGVLALEKTAGIQPEVRIADGMLSCLLPCGLIREQWDRCQVVLDTIVHGLHAIADEYDAYVRIEEVESCR